MYAALAFECYQKLQYCLLFIPLSLIVFVPVMRPYRKDLYNSLDIAMFVFFIIIASSCLYSSNEAATKLDFESVFTYSCLFLFWLCLLAHLSEPLHQLLCMGVWCTCWCPLIDRWSYLKCFSHCNTPRSSFPGHLLRPEDYKVSELSHDSYGTML